MAGDSRSLLIEAMDLPGGRRKVSFRRVWDRVEGEQGEASPA
jgi:hypothetical protein